MNFWKKTNQILLLVCVASSSCRHSSSSLLSDKTQHCAFPSGGNNLLTGKTDFDDIGRTIQVAVMSMPDPQPNAPLVAGDFCVEFMSDHERRSDMDRFAKFLNTTTSPLEREFTVDDIRQIFYRKGTLGPRVEDTSSYLLVLPGNDLNIKMLSLALGSRRTFWFTDRFKQKAYKIRLYHDKGDYADIIPVYGVADASSLGSQQSFDAVIPGSADVPVSDLLGFVESSNGSIETLSVSKSSNNDIEAAIRASLKK